MKQPSRSHTSAAPSPRPPLDPAARATVRGVDRFLMWAAPVCGGVALVLAVLQLVTGGSTASVVYQVLLAALMGVVWYGARRRYRRGTAPEERGEGRL